MHTTQQGNLRQLYNAFNVGDVEQVRILIAELSTTSVGGNEFMAGEGNNNPEMKGDSSTINPHYTSAVEIAGFNKEKLLEMCNFCGISYCQNDPELSQAGYKTKAEFINEGYSIIPFYYTNRTHAGFVFAKDREITIAYHGTQDLYDVMTDFNASFTVPSFLNDYGRMHRGFYNAFESSFKSLYSILEGYAKEQELRIQDFKINLTGHSMGGAIAKITALCLNKTENAQYLHVATFGSPKVFDLIASKNYNDVLREKTIRVTQYMQDSGRQDPVTQLPPDFCGYTDVGEELRMLASSEHGIHEINGYHRAVEIIKESEFESYNSISPFYGAVVTALNIINCVVLGSIHYVLANSIGTYLSSELELVLCDKAKKNIPKPSQFLSDVNHKRVINDLATLNL